MPKGVRGFQRKEPAENTVTTLPAFKEVVPVKELTCKNCNEFLMMGVCSRDGSKKKSMEPMCDAKKNGK